MYFVHSYSPELTADVVATCDYGGPVVAAVRRGRLWATQFHPEKSGAAGLRILANFVASPISYPVDLYPAIDLRAGRTVRLYQGDFSRETAYGTDPVTVAQAFAAAGARWIHLVDLDAARTGTPENRPVIAAIAAAVGGGGRTSRPAGECATRPSAEALLEAGVDRVVIGTAAVENPQLVRDLATHHQVAVGIDVRGRVAAVRGWLEGSGVDLFDLLARFEDCGVAAFVVTEIARDGTFAGPDLDGLAAVLEATDGRRDRLGRRRVGGRPHRPGHPGGRRAPAGGGDRGQGPPRRAVHGGGGDGRVRSVRVIPCLDVDAGRVVKGVNFVNLRDAGDPAELAARYDAEGADEIVFLDITASSDAPPHHGRGGPAHGGDGVHPLHRRRRHPHARRRPRPCCGRGPTRWGSTPRPSPGPSW